LKHLEMKWIFFCAAVVIAVSAIIDAKCHEEKPAYCARHQHLCKVPKFVALMKKVCPRTCGYCKVAFNDVAECVDIIPTYCKLRIHNCHRPPFDKIMQRLCRKSCGYCGQPITLPPTGPTKVYPPPYTGKCGQPEVKGVRVIAGTTPPRGSWPWQILLIYRGRPNCGGTLITPEWVITAAHCVYGRERTPSNFQVRVGEHNRTVVEGSEVDVTVRKIMRHPDYSRWTLNNDIAMLKLEKPVKLNKYVQPACLPKQKAPVGSKCYITGWGKTHHPGHMTTVLQQGLLPVVSNNVCYEKNRHRIPVRITDAMICGGSGGTDRISGCHGDSGGPFVCNIDGKWELHGSVSHGSPVCKSTETYTVFSRTFYFKNWIAKTVATE